MAFKDWPLAVKIVTGLVFWTAVLAIGIYLLGMWILYALMLYAMFKGLVFLFYKVKKKLFKTQTASED